MKAFSVKLIIIIYFLSVPLLKAQLFVCNDLLPVSSQQLPVLINSYQFSDINLFSCSHAELNSNNNNKKKESPMHFFFEYGPVGKTAKGPGEIKPNSYFAVGLKRHSWYETRPVQIEEDLNYRSITLNDSQNTKTSMGMLEIYLGPRIMLSKKAPVYPTASILGGCYIPLAEGGMGFNVLITAGFYYDFSGHAMTEEDMTRNGISFELTYRPVSIEYKDLDIPPAFGLRIGFFF